jgi:two-component system, chemotaxis family, response regulator Rcp1
MDSKKDSTRHRLDILLVENDPGIVEITKIAFREAGFEEDVTSVDDGDEALAFLRNEESSQGTNRPDIIFLDLHLPKQSGLEVLEEIKANPNWSVTPVVIVSGYPDLREIRKAYELHASCFIRKPNDLGEFLEFAKVCFQFWGNLVTLPRAPSARTGKDAS